MRILIVIDELADTSLDATREGVARRARLASAAASGAERAILVRAATTRGERFDGLPGLERVLEIEPAELLNPVVLDGIVRELAPRALVASGVLAAVVAGQLAKGVPRWIDFDVDPFALPPWATAQGEADPESWYFHRLLWALDQADAISAADPGVAVRLESALKIRRRIAGAEAAVRRIDAEGGLETLRSWCDDPRPRPLAPRIVGQPEIADLARLAACEAQGLRARRALPFRLREGVARGARRLAAAAGTGVDRGRALVESPFLLARAAALALTARRGSAPSRQVSEAPATPPRGRRPRVLVVMPYRLFPPRHGGATRLLAQLEELASSCELHLLRLDQRGESRIERDALERLCRRVEFHHWQVPPRAAPRAGSLPPNAWVFADERLAWRIRRWVSSEEIDVVQLECAEMAQYLPAAAPARTILVEYDVAFRSLARRRRLDLARRFGDASFQGSTWRDVLRLFRYEAAWTRRADQVQLVSEEDAAALARYQHDGAHRLRVVPNAVAIPSAPAAEPPSRRANALFVANFEHLPNRDAVAWLLAEIWPRVRSRLGAAGLTLAGARMPSEIAAQDGRDGVAVVGEVEDLTALYRRHRVVVVPLRAGSGTRLKILEAFAAETPVVSTPLGAEGLAVEPERHLLLGETAEAFAAEVARVLEEDALADALAASARELVGSRYDVRRIAGQARDAVCELATGTGRSERRPREAPSTGPALDLSIVIPTLRGGALLRRTLDAIASQRSARAFEVVCVDSGSPPEDLASIREAGARLVEIPPSEFDHGLTRDLGAARARGRVLVFLNQDAVPADELWLERLTAPLFAPFAPAAVQGGIREFPAADTLAPPRFYWDSGGPRFNFTRESRGWIARHGGIGFSTVNCAIRRDVWERIPFGWMPILEDKLWQGKAAERELRILDVPEAAVLHTHHYDLSGLLRRSRAEGEGWRRLGERYRLRDALADALSSGVWRDWRAGARSGGLRNGAEWLFPLVRPWALWLGNRAAGREIR